MRKKKDAPASPFYALGAPRPRLWPARFVYGRRSSREAGTATPDYLADANLWRRSYVRTFGLSEGQPLDSETAWFIGNAAGFWKLTSNSWVEAKRSKEDAEADGFDGICFDYVVAGEYSQASEAGLLSMGPGDLGMFQSTVEITTRGRFPRVATIFLPRARIVEALDADVAAPAFTIRKLTAAPLAPFVGAQMRTLFDLHGKISPREFETALDFTAGLLLELLRGELAGLLPPQEQGNEALKRALAYIEENYHRPGLTPMEIGRAIGVSRARLYKLFAANSLTIAGHIRELRLRRFVEALRTADDASIGRLAWTCGFEMQAADFARLFKRAYGMTPREARAALRAGQQVLPKAPPRI